MSFRVPAGRRARDGPHVPTRWLAAHAPCGARRASRAPTHMLLRRDECLASYSPCYVDPVNLAHVDHLLSFLLFVLFVSLGGMSEGRRPDHLMLILGSWGLLRMLRRPP